MLDTKFQQNQNGRNMGVQVAPTTGVYTIPVDAPKASKPVEAWTAKAKDIYVSDNLNTMDRVLLFISEFLGTAMLVFLGCMGCVTALSGGSIPHLQISFTFGLAVMLSVQCFGHISGSHINPAVTVASAILGHTPLIHIPIYFAGQMLGAIGGFALLKAATPSNFIEGGVNHTTPGVCSPHVNDLITPAQGCLVEFLLTFMLIFICAAVWDCRNTSKHDSLSIRFGLVIAVLAMAGGPYSGANMNPARSFAPALFNGDWDNHWLYWVGPLGAAVVCGFLYRFLFSKEEPEERKRNIAETIPLNDKP